MNRNNIIDAFGYVDDQYLDLVDSEILKENVIQMSTKKTYCSIKRVLLIAVTIVLLVAFATVAYANDFCGIRRTVQLWIRGDQTDVAWEVQDGEYHASYQDGN